MKNFRLRFRISSDFRCFVKQPNMTQLSPDHSYLDISLKEVLND